MKYLYDISAKNLIQNYKIEDDKIIISFLDITSGNKEEIPLNKENEEKILRLMTHQAIERNNSNALAKVKYDRRFKIVESIGFDFLFSLGAVNFIDASLFWKIVIIIYEVFNISVIGTRGIDFKLYNEYIEELKKYDIYLSIAEDLKQIDNPKVFNGIKSEDKVLNINTLDNYSLKDIKKIRENLIKIFIREFKEDYKAQEKLNKIKIKK